MNQAALFLTQMLFVMKYDSLLYGNRGGGNTGRHRMGFGLSERRNWGLKRFLGVVAVLCWGYGSAIGQQGTLSSGGTATGSGGTVTYSLGQTMYTAPQSGLARASQGVQQAYEIFVSSVLDTELEDAITLYPNPTSDYLILQGSGTDWSVGIRYRLMDALGRVVVEQAIVSERTVVEMKDLAAATYFLGVWKGGLEIKSFRVVKR